MFPGSGFFASSNCCVGIRRDPAARNYTDLALTPAADDGREDLELYQQTEDARRAAAHPRIRAESREKVLSGALHAPAEPGLRG